jgi:uncharacterized protein
MKVYIDLAPTYPRGHEDCDCDCGDCDKHGNTLLRLSSAALNSSGSSLPGKKLQQANPLYTQQCTDANWLVCNPRGSGQLAVLDQEAFDLLAYFKNPASPEEVMQADTPWSSVKLREVLALFYRLGFLHEEGLAPSGVGEKEEQTLTAWLHVTNACNLRCDYCYIQKTQEHMQADTGYKAIDAVFRSALKHHIPAIHLKYAGGEASLHMSGVMALHDYAVQLAQQHGIALSANLLSNGMALSERAIENLQVRGIRVMISLDGVGEVHDRQRVLPNGQGSFKYVRRTITRLLEKGLVPSISVTLSQRNLDGLPELMRYLLQLELPFTLNYYRDHVSVLSGQNLRFEDQEMISAMRAAFQVIKEALPRYSLLGSLLDKATAQAPHTHTCSMGRNYLVIDQHGGIAKCQAQIKRRVTTIEHTDPLQAIREDREGVQNLAVDEKEGCRSCEWRYWCTGGCPLLTYQVTGRNDIRSPNCNIYKALFPDVLHLEALRLLAYQVPLLYERETDNAHREAQFVAE